MKNKTKRYCVKVDCSDNPHSPPRYAYLDFKGKLDWKTKRIAQKHAREYKARHLRDAWVEEC